MNTSRIHPRNWRAACFLFLSFICLTGCAPVRTYSVETLSTVREAQYNVVASGRLSLDSLQLLRMAGLTEKQAESGDYTVDPARYGMEPALKRYHLASELTLAKAIGAQKSGSPLAPGEFLLSARYALTGIFEPECRTPLNLLCDNLKLYYARAVMGLVDFLASNNWSGQLEGLRSYNDKTFTLSVASENRFEDPRSYDSIRPSAEVGIEGLANLHRRYGIGLPLTACRHKRGDDPSDKFLPNVGTCVPLTAVLQFPDAAAGADSFHARLEFHNAFVTDTVAVNGRELPLAANFSAPFASLIERTGYTDFSGMFAALRSDETYFKRTGFFSTEPYDALKIPIITVHGLFSSPITWISVQNDLMGDEEIRRRYQVWHYIYPTNLPILENARTFREKLDELEAHLQAASPSRRGMVIIAHSMGGLLTKTVVAHDSTAMFDFLFGSARPLETIDPQIRAELSGYLNFKRKPYVDRVIFVAVPHRGSSIADNWIGRIGRALISLPQAVVSRVTKTLTDAAALLRPEVRKAVAEDKQDFSSIKGLSPRNPMIEALSMVAVEDDVPFHSIIGDRGKGGGAASSDGVVPYTSAHLEGAESELIVPAGHAAHLHPLAFQEIRRILRLHLAKLEQSGLAPPGGKAEIPIQ